MKKLLMMGSNFGSIEILREAKKRGYYTIVTDYYGPERSLAKRECDECWDISTAETEKLAEKCREAHVDGISCGVSEFNSEMTFRLCDALGLPKYCDWDAWAFTRNKRIFKDMCKKHGVRVAQDYDIKTLVSGEMPEDLQFPVVVKPIDCCANIGVSFCHTADELAPAYELAKSVTKQPESIICEQMLQGREYAAAYALLDGEASLLNVFVMHNEEGTAHNIYVLDITTTGVLDQYLAELDKGLKEVFKDAGFGNGIVWVELFLNDSDQKMYVLECGYRFPASMIPYLYKEIAGFDAISWYLDPFMGIQHTRDQLPESQTKEYDKYGVSYLLWNHTGGIIKEFSGLDKVAADDRILFVDCLRKPGYELTPNTSMAEVLFTADSREEVIEVVKFVNDTVSVIVEDGTDVLIRYTSFDKIV